MKHSYLLVAVLTACGGGGGGGEPASAPTLALAPTTPATVPPLAPAPPLPAPPVSGGTGVVAATDNPPASELEPAPEPQQPVLKQPRPSWPTGPDAPRSMRSTPWWGTHAVELNRANQECQPQPECRIPDGDLNLHNAACDSGELMGDTCSMRLRLYDEPDVELPPRQTYCTTTYRCPAGGVVPGAGPAV